MRAFFFSLVLVAAAGCQPQGSLVHVFVDATPALTTVSTVNVTIVANNQTSKKTFTPAAPAKTPIDFSIAFPSSYVGKMAMFTVDLFDNKGGQLGIASGSTTIAASTTELHLTAGGPASMCPMGQTSGPLCDGFENGRMNFWNMPVIMGSGSKVEIVGDKFARGTHSLHVATGAIPADMAGLVIATLNETTYIPDTLFARTFVYVPSSFDSNIAGAIMILENQTTFAQIEVSVENQGLSVYDSIDGMKYTPQATLSYDSWHCIELEVQRGTPGAINLWIDDAPVLSKGGVATNGNFNMLAVGLTDTLPGSPGRELWLDEVAVDGQRITCAK
jgi:hypothetical protein